MDADPRRRPGSACEVAAALTGGDPLGVAAAFGETPPPDLVASAGEHAVRPAVAWWWLAGCLAGLAGVLLMADRTFFAGLAGLPLSGEVLAHKAMRIVERLEPADRGLEQFSGFLVTGASPAKVVFEYILAPRLEAPDRPLLRSTRGPSPIAAAGTRYLRLAADGRLLTYIAVPGPTLDPGSAPGRPDWADVLQPAGLTTGSLRAVGVRRRPPVPCDAMQAWESADAGAGPLHVEAASLAGRIVFFNVDLPGAGWRRPGAAGEPILASPAAAGVRHGVFMLALAGAVVLAWKNVALAAIDGRGAIRFAGFVLCGEMASWAVRHRHEGGPAAELGWAILALRLAVFTAVIVWLFYAAAEPFVRRRWPQAMVSWSRLLAGRWRDPVVGRDILVGGVFGTGWVLLHQLAVLLPGATARLPCVPFVSHGGGQLGPLAGARQMFGELVDGVLTAAWVGLLLVVLMVLCRAVLRAARPATVAFVPVVTAALALTWGFPHARQWVVYGVIASAAAMMLTRAGVLPVIAGLLVAQVIQRNPMTLDLDAWFAESAVFAGSSLVVLWAMGLYACLRPQRR